MCVFVYVFVCVCLCVCACVCACVCVRAHARVCVGVFNLIFKSQRNSRRSSASFVRSATRRARRKAIHTSTSCHRQILSMSAVLVLWSTHWKKSESIRRFRIQANPIISQRSRMETLPRWLDLEQMYRQRRRRRRRRLRASAIKTNHSLTSGTLQLWLLGRCTHACVYILPWPKESLQLRYSWDWSAVRSCDIMQHRLRSATRNHDAQRPRIASMLNQSSILHDITWSNCRSASWISRL